MADFKFHLNFAWNHLNFAYHWATRPNLVLLHPSSQCKKYTDRWIKTGKRIWFWVCVSMYFIDTPHQPCQYYLITMSIRPHSKEQVIKSFTVSLTDTGRGHRLNVIVWRSKIKRETLTLWRFRMSERNQLSLLDQVCRSTFFQLIRSYMLRLFTFLTFWSGTLLRDQRSFVGSFVSPDYMDRMSYWSHTIRKFIQYLLWVFYRKAPLKTVLYNLPWNNQMINYQLNLTLQYLVASHKPFLLSTQTWHINPPQS